MWVQAPRGPRQQRQWQRVALPWLVHRLGVPFLLSPQAGWLWLQELEELVIQVQVPHLGCPLAYLGDFDLDFGQVQCLQAQICCWLVHMEVWVSVVEQQAQVHQIFHYSFHLEDWSVSVHSGVPLVEQKLWRPSYWVFLMLQSPLHSHQTDYWSHLQEAATPLNSVSNQYPTLETC